MHRNALLDVLERAVARHPADRERAGRIATFVRAHPDCFERSCAPGHVTGSAWIVSADGSHALLTHHRKLGRWLQLGGHADGDTDPFRVALREAREESGLADFSVPNPLCTADGVVVPLDLDIHEIPARGDEPAHLHHDIRYLLVAAAGAEIRCSQESNELRWFAADSLDAQLDEESLLRLSRRARAVLAGL